MVNRMFWKMKPEYFRYTGRKLDEHSGPFLIFYPPVGALSLVAIGDRNIGQRSLDLASLFSSPLGQHLVSILHLGRIARVGSHLPGKIAVLQSAVRRPGRIGFAVSYPRNSTGESSPSPRTERIRPTPGSPEIMQRSINSNCLSGVRYSRGTFAPRKRTHIIVRHEVLVIPKRT